MLIDVSSLNFLVSIDLIILLIYVYPFFFYPSILYLSCLFKRQSFDIKHIDEESLPAVSIIISAYNEQGVIKDKIMNSLALDYPKDRLEIIVISDGSTDSTSTRAREFLDQGIVVAEIPERKGKTNAQNEGVKLSKEEIIVFSDANTILKSDSLRIIVECLLSSDRIGCVSGNLVYKSNKISGELHYQTFEFLIKKMESKFFSITGANGALYALRREDYIPLPVEIISDFVEPLEIYRVRNKTSIVSKDAIAFEEEPHKGDFKGTLIRKSRILLRGLQGLAYERSLLNPFKHPKMCFELVSHKMIKWLSPILLLFVYVSPLFFLDKSKILIFSIFNSLILFALLGYLFYKRTRKFSFFNYSFYFLEINLADLLGWFYFFTHKEITTWETKGR